MVKRVLLVAVVISLSMVTTAQVANGIALLPNDSLLFKSAIATGPTPPLRLISVTGEPIAKAYQVSTLNQTGNEYNLRYVIDSAVRRGDIMLLSFYTRSLQSKKETGESFMEISLDRVINGKYEWPPVFERGMSFGKTWTLTQIPFVAARDVQKGDMALVIKSGKFPQVFELGGISLINYKQSVTLASLPRSTVHYDGDAPDAPWRKAAAERIERYRKGDLTVKVLDKAGHPVEGAVVSVRLTKNSFAWGTATNSKLILDSLDPVAKIYRDTLLRYFNKVVFENEMKSKNWARSNHDQTKAALTWFDQHGIPARGHVMVWPSWQNSPHLLAFKSDTAALRAAIMKDIVDETTVMRNRFTEWDVVNEPFAHDVFLQLLGRRVMVDWFRAARERTPGVKLFLNDYTMFHGEGPASASEKFFDNIKFLQDNKTPIDAIGEQGHIGGTPPGIAYVVERLDHFATLGLPIQISEFDVTSDDEEFKARYIRDFITAVFSHPATIGIMQWGFWAGSHWIPAAALWDKEWHIRPAGTVFTELVSKTFNTNVQGSTVNNGEYKTRGFTGKYEVSVEYKHKRVQQEYTLTNKGGSVVIKLN